ncbi:hypothetical protein AWZ03_006891 [Drosophila navojoa]|uniref:Gustatory receptor n=1 Tax=Drosophila navojoa TaxID=7232 RepID=A0A484BG40_DRONA|nr:hypothetical protein AWZ03_006891 [Drosophila navojoa]
MAVSARRMVVHRLQYFLYQLFAYYAIFIGVTSYFYDFKRRLYKNTKWTQLIACLSNLIIVSVTISDLAWLWLDYVNEDRVTGEITQLDFTVNDIVCVVNLLQRVPRERATKNIEQELESLTRLCQKSWARKDKQSKQDIRRLRSIYLAKDCIMWIFTGVLSMFLIMSYEFMSMRQTKPYIEHTLVILKILAFDSQDAIMHLHFLLSLKICRLYMRLNSRMRELIERNSSADALEVLHLRRLHLKLTFLMERLSSVYGVIIISTRFSLIVTTAVMGYYISISVCLPTVYKIVCCGFYALLILDAYILDLILDYTINEHQKTSFLLRRHYELDDKDTQLSREFDEFALQLTSFPMQIKPYGLLTCSTATWLSDIACIICWMVVLIQYRIVSEKRQNNV